MRQQVRAVLSESPSLDFRSHRELALAGAVHAEFWRRFSEGPYQCFSCNEKNDRGSISFGAPEPCLCHTNVLAHDAARYVPGSMKSRWFSGLGLRPFFLRTQTVKSIDTRHEASATTSCNAHLLITCSPWSYLRLLLLSLTALCSHSWTLDLR